MHCIEVVIVTGFLFLHDVALPTVSMALYKDMYRVCIEGHAVSYVHCPGVAVTQCGLEVP